MLQKKDKRKVLFFREPVFKVSELIFNKPNKKFHIRMLERETKLSTTAIKEAISELLKFKIIKTEKTPLTLDIKADLESEAHRHYKLVFNLYKLKLYEIIDELSDLFSNPETIILFGSYSKGEDIEESDIDLLIISKNKPNTENFRKSSEKKLERHINLIVLPDLSKSSQEFKNAIANGIVLKGYLKLR